MKPPLLQAGRFPFLSGVRFWMLCGLLPCLLTSGLTGCTTLSLTPSWMSFKQKKDLDTPVIEIMALWQPGEGRDLKGLPARGFAGQVFFFKQGSRTPVEVHGDVKIYLFDDRGTEEEQLKPIHVYEFKGEAWNAYKSKSNIGQAYQVFIPYTRPGNHRAICSLRVKFTGEKGDSVLSDPADVILVGKQAKVQTETQITRERPAIPSSLPTQQTHLATINRAGKVQTKPSDAWDLVQAAPNMSQKNTQVSHYEASPDWVGNLAPIQQAGYQGDPAENSTGTGIQQANWNEHTLTPQNRQQSVVIPASAEEMPASPLKPAPVPSSAGQTHPLADSARTAQKPRHSPPSQTSTHLFDHPLSGSVSREQSASNQAWAGHPLSNEQKSAEIPKSSLKVKTITLE